LLIQRGLKLESVERATLLVTVMGLPAPNSALK